MEITISSWACQQGQSKSINVQLFGLQTTSGVTKEGALFAEAADLFSEPGVAEVCRDHEDGKHRFILALPYGYGPDSKPSVHGIRVVEGVPNDLIAGSGQSLPVRALDPPYATIPDLRGTYRALTHPDVFVTAERVKRHRLADQWSRKLLRAAR